MLGVRGAGEPPVATFATTGAFTDSEVGRVIVIESWMSTDVSTSPALAGEGEANSPATAAFRQLILEHWGTRRTFIFSLPRYWARYVGQGLLAI